MNTTNFSFSRGTLLALGAAFISGISVFVAKLAVTGPIDAVALTSAKNILAALFLSGLLLALRQWGAVRALSRAQWWKLLVIGAAGGSLPFALFFMGLKTTSAVNGALIHKTLFLWVALLAVPFLGERLRPLQWLGVVAIFAANLLPGGFTGFQMNSGELLILAATLLWAVENIVAKKVLREIPFSIVAWARMTIGSALLLGFLSVTGSAGQLLSFSAQGWFWVGVTGALLFAYVSAWYGALQLAPASYVASLLVLSTIITNFLSAVFVTHQLRPVDLATSVLYLAGAALLIGFASRARETSVAVSANA
jgi:drug/metabolite transporter (DMT)-like permease